MIQIRRDVLARERRAGRLFRTTLVLWAMIIAVPPVQAAAPVDLGVPWGWMVGLMNLLGRCARYDSRDADTYMTILGKYELETAPLRNRIAEIFQTEAAREGQSGVSEVMAKAAADMVAGYDREYRTDPSGFIGKCRTLPDSYRRKILWFAPIEQRYPEVVQNIRAYRP